MKARLLPVIGAVFAWVVVEAADAAEPPQPIGDKTLVVWATVADLAQRGAGLLTVQEGERFDSVVYGERVSARWMAGSDFFRRTASEETQAACASEDATPDQLLQIAIVYSGNRVTLYRNGRVASSYEVAAPERFDEYFVLVGLRYLGALGATGFYAGEIEETRLYARALGESEIAALRVNQSSTPALVGWWTFEDGTATDRTGHFPAGTLVGDARIDRGRLILNGSDAFMVVERFTAERQGMFYQPRSRATGRMWDTWLYFRAGTYYLYYLANCGRTWDNISLATSDDGVHWREHGVVLRKRRDAVWMGTGSTWRSPRDDQPETYVLNFSEWRGNQQTIFFAESKDLVTWERLDDAYQFAPDPQWYNVNEGNNSRWDCIYTMPRAEGGLFGYWTATPKEATEGRFGFGQTVDGVTWCALPPPKTPRVDAGEVGAIARIGEQYYMMFGTGGIMITLVASRPEGPFVPAERNLRLLSGHTYFARFFPSPEGLLVNHHSIARDGSVCCAPLKATRVDDQQTLRLAWWPGNEKLKAGAAIPLAIPCSTWDRTLQLSEAVDAQRGVVLEGELALPGPADAHPAGLFVQCGADRGVVLRVDSAGATEIGPLSLDGGGFQCDKRVDRQWAFGRTARFRLLLKQTFLEFYLDDLLVECFSLPETATGRIGAISSDGLQCVWNVKAWCE